MKALTCEMCGSQNIEKDDYWFVCQDCKQRYLSDEYDKLIDKNYFSVFEKDIELPNEKESLNKIDSLACELVKLTNQLETPSYRSQSIKLIKLISRPLLRMCIFALIVGVLFGVRALIIDNILIDYVPFVAPISFIFVSSFLIIGICIPFIKLCCAIIREKALIAIDHKAIQFYIECKNSLWQGQDIKETISIRGQKYGLKNIKQAQSYYEKGKQDIKKQAIATAYQMAQEKKAELLNEHTQEQATATAIHEQRFATGKAKYLVKVNEWRALISKQKDIAEKMKTISHCNANYKAPKKDWAIAGGIANALGGLGIGLATAAHTHSNNEKEKELAQEKHELAITQMEVSAMFETEAKYAEPKILKYIAMMDKVYIDTQDIENKFKLLEYSDLHIDCTKHSNLVVSMTLKCLSKPTILSKPAILDGTLKISILNKENQEVATGYYNAGGYAEYNYQNAGFKAEENIKVICPLNTQVNVEDLHCRVTPEALWFIEENMDIFNIKNTEISNAYSEYRQNFEKQSITAIFTL